MIIKKILLIVVKLYQLFISPFLRRNCRFEPTCSQYAQDAIEKYGAFRGFGLFLKRLLKCHPLNEGGYDPVPELKE